METTSIVLPNALTAANSKKLLSNCRSALTRGELCLDGSSLASMDYSADAFFALLAELSEKTGNRLVLAHFSPEIKQHLQNLRKMEPPEKPERETNNILEMMGGTGFMQLRETFEVLVLLFSRFTGQSSGRSTRVKSTLAESQSRCSSRAAKRWAFVSCSWV